MNKKEEEEEEKNAFSKITKGPKISIEELVADLSIIHKLQDEHPKKFLHPNDFQHHIQVFYNTNMFITPVNTPGTYLIVHNPESNFLRVCSIQNQGDHMDIVIPWLELDQAELRGHSIDGWLLFSYRQHIIYYDVVNRRNHSLHDVPWELADHIGVFSSSPLEYGNITIFAEHSEDEMEVLLHTEERGWRRYVVPADMATNICVCGLVLHEGKLLCLDTSGQVHIFHLDRLGEYVSSIALLPDHFDPDDLKLYFASLVVDVAAVYVIILLEEDMDEVGIKWFELTQRDGEYILERVFDAGEHFAYAVGNRNGYRFNPSFDNIGRRGSLLAGSLNTNIDCIWIDNVIPPEWETFKECSEEDCPCSCAFVRVGAHQF